jgi:hypothetical protein
MEDSMTVRTAPAWHALAAGALAALALGAAHAQTPIETTTPSGDRILLYPDGRWEYADPAKRAAMPKPAASAPATPQSAGTAPAAGATPVAASATPIAASATPTGMQACPPGTQGHLFWLGRCVPPGDKDYNRGSLSGKGR